MSWKRTIRPAMDRLGRFSGLLRVSERAMRSRLTILMYHRVLEDADCAGYPFSSLAMPRSLFEAQVDWLAQNARVLPVSEALSRLEDASAGSKPLVSLTFDDGYQDNFDIAAPLLEAAGLRGTFFITAGIVDARKPLWYDRAAHIWDALGHETISQRVSESGAFGAHDFPARAVWVEWLKDVSTAQRESLIEQLGAEASAGGSPCVLMTAAQVRELAERGHEIGSHTLWHPILTTMNEGERRPEIEGAKNLLERWTGRDVPGFCYPNGDFDQSVIRQLREAGHTYACTTRPGLNEQRTNPFELRRIDMTADRLRSSDGRFDVLGFRAEISLFRHRLRGALKPSGWRGE